MSSNIMLVALLEEALTPAPKEKPLIALPWYVWLAWAVAVVIFLAAVL